MIKKQSMVVNLIDGGSKTWAKGSVKGYSVMQQGLFFIQGVPVEKTKKDESLIVTTVGTWVPLNLIKSVELITETTVEAGQELKKYRKFQEHGIDMTMDKISETVVSPADVAKKINAEATAEIVKDKIINAFERGEKKGKE